MSNKMTITGFFDGNSLGVGDSVIVRNKEYFITRLYEQTFFERLWDRIRSITEQKTYWRYI